MTNSTHLWQEFHPRLRRFILQQVKHPQDAEDILQDVFLRIHQRLSTVRESDRIVAWMFQIARNAAIDYYRVASRRREIASGNVEDLNCDRSTVYLDDLRSVDAPLNFNQEIARCLHPLLEKLPESYRKAIDLVEIQGISQRVVAKTLGLSLSGAKSRVQRGRQKLKDLLLECCQVRLDIMGNILEYKLNGSECSTRKEESILCCKSC